MDTENRLAGHQRNPQLEGLLHFFEDKFGPLERQVIEDIPSCDKPVLFIVGCARSGTTLVLQYLSKSGLFAYPTNFLSRFYFAPFIGATLQQMLVDYDHNGEVFGGTTRYFFESNLGKTQGPLAPHEFWYFWRRFFAFGDDQQISENSLAAVDGLGFMKEISALQSVSMKPFVAKGMICNWNLPFLAGLHPRIHFLFVHRDIEDNVNSLLSARLNFFGDLSKWYSFKPPGYQQVLNLSPKEQVEWQIQSTNASIRKGLDEISHDRVFETSYTDFCANPRDLLDKIFSRWSIPLPIEMKDLPLCFDIKKHNKPSSESK
jgi:hypothetical protein